LNRVIAALHRVDIDAVGLADYGKPGNYVERQVARWSRQYESAGGDRIPSMDRLIEWLPRHVPPSDETAIVHGDYRIDNVIFHPREPRVLAVLDWELSTLGHPLSDFAYQVMAWRLSPQQFRGLKGFDLPALGIPTEEEYIAMYCRRPGRSAIPGWDIYLIFNMFRIAAILHGVLARALQGNAASSNAVEQGSRARLVADTAWEMARDATSPSGARSGARRTVDKGKGRTRVAPGPGLQPPGLGGARRLRGKAVRIRSTEACAPGTA
jgi:aminoglycoside phosphotransferase (APT) family kinase protein